MMLINVKRINRNIKTPADLADELLAISRRYGCATVERAWSLVYHDTHPDEQAALLKVFQELLKGQKLGGSRRGLINNYDERLLSSGAE